jgi:peptidyl-dipeptidase Dcp
MNPLLQSPLVDDQHHIPFHLIRDEHYGPALEEGIQRAKKGLAALSADSSEPTFANTIEAIEAHREDLDRISNVFFNMVSAHTNDTLQALAKEISPKLAELANDLLLDPKIFARVKKVYEQRETLGLNTEQAQLLDNTYKAFRRNGANLSDADKEKLRELDRNQARLGQVFSDHVLKATNEYVFFVDDESALRELPPNALEEAKATAKDKGRPESWAFTLQFPSYLPFMQFCSRSDLRRELWTAYLSRGMREPNDNRPVLKEIARLRYERARLLGYSSHAHFVLEERMAASPDRVRGFIDELLRHSRPAAERDLAEVRQVKASHDGKEEFYPWDFAYYSERLRREKYNFSQEDLRPYFRLENVISGVFEHARRLYGIVFRERKDIPVYHPDVKAYEVRNESDDRFMGYFYADFFPRASKKGGAWMTNFLEQGSWEGKNCRPHVSIVCNFTKPTASQPSLITHEEVRTLFHEFGHALHSLLTDCHYASLSGTNVYWDFVELPSQIMENWVKEEEGLALFAKHYETGAPLPKDLLQKIQDSSQFLAGWASLRQISFCLLDLAWHAGNPGDPADLEEFERKQMGAAQLFPHVPGTALSAAFSHIFSGGYSAGYYSYKWAEVLDADAFEYFKEKGIFNREVARSFRDNVLARGGTEHPMELYKRFRGREPDPKALLRRDGLISV